MTSPVFSISADATLDSARQRLAQHNVSSLLVYDEGRPVAGVISRSDLLAVGTVELDPEHGALHLHLPPKKVRELATIGVVTVDPEVATVQAAAQRMVEQSVHRVFAVEACHAYGVVSTRDVTRAIADARLTQPVRTVMSTPVHTIDCSLEIESALARLRDVGTSALVVIDSSKWPVGILTQVEALEARGFFSVDSVDRVVSTRFIAVHPESALHHVAARAVATRARHALVLDRDEIVGIVSGLDFARAAAEWEPKHAA